MTLIAASKRCLAFLPHLRRNQLGTLLALSLISAPVLSSPQKVPSPSASAASGPTPTAQNPQPPRPQTSASVLPPPSSFDAQAQAAAVLSHLNAVVRIFRLSLAPIQKIGEPSDMLYRDQALTQATQIADLAFQSSRAEADLLTAFSKQSGTLTAPPVEGEAQKLQSTRAGVTQRLADLKSQQQTINKSLETARASQRPALQQQLQQTEGGIELYQAMSDALHKIALTADNGANSGLSGDIDRLQRSVPELVSGKTKAILPAPLENLSTARSSGVSTQAVVLFQLLATRHAIDAWIG